MRFCANPKCKLHYYETGEERRLSVFELDRHGVSHTVEYRNRMFENGKGEIAFFCEVCTAAIELFTGEFRDS
jgi:hypothetical protein